MSDEAIDGSRPQRHKPPPLTRFRLLTGPLRVLPDFLILGEMRSGTSSLSSYLREHPQVLPPWRKELNYFSRLFARGTVWYRANFPTVTAMLSRKLTHGGTALTFEGSPDYLIYPATARRLSSIIPNAKLIALLRNPTDRAYAHYQLNLRTKIEHHSFEQAIKREAKRLEGEREKLFGDEPYPSRRLRRYSYVSRGIYVDNLRAYEQYFPREQMLVIKSEDLFEKTQETYDEILHFLGLAPWRLRSTESVNTAPYSREKPAGYDELREFFAPHNQRLYEYLGRDLGW